MNWQDAVDAVKTAQMLADSRQIAFVVVCEKEHFTAVSKLHAGSRQILETVYPSYQSALRYVV